MSTPIEEGYRMPAEWEEQEAVWIAWPHNEITWPGMLKDVEETYVRFVEAMHEGQIVRILVNDVNEQARIETMLSEAGINITQIEFFKIKNVDAWIRDYGPTFVSKQEKVSMVKWTFNAWGHKYDDLLADDKIPHEMNSHLKMKMFDAGIVLEGGSIDVNGNGIVLTTEQCLLNKNRNPTLSREEIELKIKEYLNAVQIIWLNEGIEGDDTDGHIDDIARFVNENTVVCCFEENKSDKNYKILKKNYDTLTKVKTVNGKKLNVVKLPMPGSVGDDKGRLPASYANFYIGNEAVAVPIFGHENDDKAVAIIKSLFPGRKIVAINCTAMVHGLGTLHCTTQQQPKGL